MTTTGRFAYFYLMKADGERVRAAVPRHVAHWRDLGLEGYVGGPFDDRTGGLITFDAPELAQAQAVVEADPFLQEDLVERYWLKQWVPE